MLLSALGLGALLAASETAFLVLKAVGAAYLIWLGIKTFRSRATAFDAMPSGGRLVVSTADATVASDLVMDAVTVPAGEYVTLSVSDTGVGMTDETRSRLFEPFFTTKGSGLGTGLGLSTVYGIIKQSGGEIAVSTVLGAGSTFVAYLPRVSGEGA